MTNRLTTEAHKELVNAVFLGVFSQLILNPEVDLCGHATLGAAHALWSTGRASKRRRIDFETKASGVLTCELSETGWIQMDFPADSPNVSDTIQASLPHEDELSKALGLQPGSVRHVGRGRFDILCEVEPREFDP